MGCDHPACEGVPGQACKYDRDRQLVLDSVRAVTDAAGDLSHRADRLEAIAEQWREVPERLTRAEGRLNSHEMVAGALAAAAGVMVAVWALL